MLIKEFRGVDFIDRDKEIEFFLDYFKQNPERILWIYGPKSTGKTTLIEYMVENYLMESNEYNAKYINFRGKMVANYDNFIDAFIKPKDSPFFKNLSMTLNLHFIKIDSNLYKDIKSRRLDFFEAVQEEFLNYSNNKKNILIIDEIQTLQDIYMNGGKALLNEFLNFCVRLTKELHISHVLILTSNTIFLEEIYDNAKLKATSSFKLIGHVSRDTIITWLKSLNSKLIIQNSSLIYDYLGGHIGRIKKLLDEYKNFNSIKEYLENEVELAYSEIDSLLMTKRDKYIKPLIDITKDILKKGYFLNSSIYPKEYFDTIKYFCEREILFYNPADRKVTANSKIYEKGFEKLVSSG